MKKNMKINVNIYLKYCPGAALSPPLPVGCCLPGDDDPSRPPALFSDTSPAISNTSTTSNRSVEEEEEGESEGTMKESYDMIGLGFALAVPVLGAWIAIITRSVHSLSLVQSVLSFTGS